MLTDFQEARRQKATQMLIALGNHVPLPRLLDLLNHPSERVRASVVQILGKQEKETPISALLSALIDQVGPVREAARQALRVLGESVVEHTFSLTSALEYVRRRYGPWGSWGSKHPSLSS
jgi:HEAT repeat protein